MHEDPIYRKSHGEKVKKVLNTEEVKEKIRKIHNDPIRKEKIRKIAKERYEKNREFFLENLRTYWKNPENRKQQSIRFKKNFIDPRFMKSRRNYFIDNISKSQLKLYDMIKDICPTAELEYSIDRFFIDIAIPDKKIAIEYNASYWHQDKERDLKRQKLLESQGWKFIRYIDHLSTSKEFKSDIGEINENKS